MTRGEMEAKYPGLYYKLGTAPDTDLGKEYGLSGPAVKRLRDCHGIPPCGHRVTPSAEEWEALLAFRGEIAVGQDRRTIIVGGCVVTGRTLRQAVLLAIRGAAGDSPT